MVAKKIYPKEMAKNCALPSCNKEMMVIVNSHLEMRRLVYCCEEHRKERRFLARNGDIEPHKYVGKNNDKYASRGNWPDDLGLGPRKKIEDIK